MSFLTAGFVAKMAVDAQLQFAGAVGGRVGWPAGQNRSSQK
jgi:hypothetical protein